MNWDALNTILENNVYSCSIEIMEPSLQYEHLVSEITDAIKRCTPSKKQDLIVHKQHIVKDYSNRIRDSHKKSAASIGLSKNLTCSWNMVRILKNEWTKTNHADNDHENVIKKEDLNSALNKLCPQWVPIYPEFFQDTRENELFDQPLD
ncbi:hypothetical protein HHI36_013153 [Cryptolaemus montrouzieri]|uniref:Uncharacterized protein n=1 Tax=Cryptolaemus montrouzieri TaxID=559131 RepID=A0ABD2NHP9_9CUCU